jgi:tetratricopeptide (TPR) repeat protein
VSARRITIGAAAAVSCLAGLLLGGVWRDSSPASSAVVAQPSAAAQAPQLAAGFAAGDTEAQVAKLQGQLRADPYNTTLLDQLALAYQQRARETGDPTYYTKSGEALQRVLQLAPRDLVATSALGSLALSRHRFSEALVLGREAHSISPTTARNYGVIGDALVELGRYRAGFAAYDTMATMQPSLSSYSRVAHARYLLGNVPGALSAFRLALAASEGQGEAEAWTHVQLGLVHWAVGSLDEAAAEDRAALRAFPGYPLALDALARVRAAQGHLREGIALEQQAVDRIPLPQYVSTLGDLYLASGRAAPARRQYATISVIERLLRANGVQTDLETALFDADHGRESIPLARKAERERPSIDGDDVLAWTLERAGRCAEALPYSKRALRLGTPDALKLFHRGMIERCLGRTAEARVWFRRAVRLNPHFSFLWGTTARRLAR